MDEMTRLRELRADAPVPDRSALAPGRQRLAQAVASGRRTRRMRADWRIASVGAAAAITVAAVLGTQLVDAAAPDRSGPAATTGTLRLDSPAEVLNRAADTLEKQQAAPEPRDDQWIYTKTVMAQSAQSAQRSSAVGSFTYDPDNWVPYDNSAAAKNGKDDDYRTSRQVYRAANELPDDPARLLAKVRSFYPTGNTAENPPEAEAQHSFRAMGLMVEAYPIAPTALARIYRALATVPGVQVTGHLVKDAAGREVIAITRKEDGSHGQREILLDPHDFRYAGMRFVVTEDYEYASSAGKVQFPSEKFKAGQIMMSEARVKAAVVDAKGEKP
ncbi:MULTISPECIES: CU044_5270 family protein [unclassified Streptomyces]|uniref:CU044_5270 family protein n=1 Tax=unclassified Streptomyces TaxID=2593676 RepID=UPI002255B34E|nr:MULTISPECIES: CU044_5270 family protein [unclassified Streptomyces]WSP56935.1 CU044_5270 family protein [Streptomyces sp. NBC_01241]WSU22348.1 CU044_5270 family protein [Streptomyces sp. NBC_01108]MCX4788720.1 CU044_5270 family protein [Streptomyces sp. NBC_01221]WSJ36820.1 CU044_5270 family protein [Streptomyces sp. NBC_01321]WSP63239.1 CU044_5270 family protein [Streptomyces sp. NBC_01240]